MGGKNPDDHATPKTKDLLYGGKTTLSKGGPTSGGVVQSWTSVRTGVLARRASVRDLEREERKTMEEARSARCPKEQIQRGHADVAERRAG